MRDEWHGERRATTGPALKHLKNFRLLLIK
jgi:hypothetical protein